MTREQSRLLYRWVIDTYSPNYKPANNELLNPLLYIMEKDVELLMEADALLSWQGLRHVPQVQRRAERLLQGENGDPPYPFERVLARH